MVPPRACARVVVTALLAAAALAGCATVQEQPPAAVALATSVPTDGLVGTWGIASYREEDDRARTEAIARQQCRIPYVIERGPTDGVMMHAADDPKLYELKLKGASDGRTYIGFEAPPGHRQDREILSYEPDLITMRFVDPDVHARYGTFIYTRCPA
ncbi:MAG TPA: hypothetical protein VMP03_02935 [Methylomirabilota bacterium]|nr:hypothetical protein [Methylomirabilota bacterium]